MTRSTLPPLAKRVAGRGEDHHRSGSPLLMWKCRCFESW
jgi:hypothetical protein